ncbi:MAG: hypothetical protein CL904_05125 [Dehalococcoidia bacterium]|nr:hypothetical protein [Dehalococcoidia bacterium]MQG15682.1 hypothetical protein [SAR202 cluster bacterium]|tara:strand:- start:5474 stop:6616 length:1143 start_codon:yes stop_codon:yes gene_type:complete
MDSNLNKFISSLHASEYRCVLALAGAGSRALSWLLEVPGSSRTLIEATVPYSLESLSELLGKRPQTAVSMRTAQYMAQKAFCKAKLLCSNSSMLIGVGCTATIATDREKKGDHKAYISIMSEQGLTNWYVQFTKGLLTRSQEEQSISHAILYALSNTINLSDKLDIELDQGVELEYIGFDYGVSDLVDDSGYLYFEIDTPIKVGNEFNPGAILPGSFDPIHAGHTALLKASEEFLRKEVVFELSMANVDKPDISVEDASIRINQMFGKWPLILTRADTFSRKAKLFPGAVFVVGYDTGLRIIDSKYYDNDVNNMIEQLDEIKQLKCSFVVAARCINGSLLTLKDLKVPKQFADIFHELPIELFREDISSTEIRANSLDKE